MFKRVNKYHGIKNSDFYFQKWLDICNQLLSYYLLFLNFWNPPFYYECDGDYGIILK